MKTNNNDELLFVNPQTGELIDKVSEGDRIKITRKEQLDFIANTKALNYNDFHMANNEELRLVFKELTSSERAFLSSVALYMNYNDCCLKYSNGKDITIENLPEITGMSRRQCFTVIGLLVKKDIIYKGRNGRNVQLYLNPCLYCKGNRYNKVLQNMFKNYRMRSKNNVRWGELIK